MCMHRNCASQSKNLADTRALQQTHVMPPTLKVVVAIWAVGVFNDSPDCFEALSGIRMSDGAILCSGCPGSTEGIFCCARR